MCREQQLYLSLNVSLEQSMGVKKPIKVLTSKDPSSMFTSPRCLKAGVSEGIHNTP